MQASTRAGVLGAGSEDSETDWVELYVSMGLSAIDAESLVAVRREASDRDSERRDRG